MVHFNLRVHPNVLFAYAPNSTDLILRLENTLSHPCWIEADIFLPDRLSLGPDSDVRKGRLRLGIVGKDEGREKTVRVYANNYTKPQMYRCRVVVFSYDRDGVISSRLERPVDIRCEMKKEATL